MFVFRIREANQDDADAMAKVRVDTWRAAYQGIVPDDFLNNLSRQQIAESWKKRYWEVPVPGVVVFAAENERKEIVGVAFFGPEQNQDPVYRGEVQRLYVLPACQNRGIGRELVAVCVQHLEKTLKFKTMLIWTFAENPYRKFYEKLGGKMVREKNKEIGGKNIMLVGYGWEDISELAISKPAGETDSINH